MNKLRDRDRDPKKINASISPHVSRVVFQTRRVKCVQVYIEIKDSHSRNVKKRGGRAYTPQDFHELEVFDFQEPTGH